MADNYLLVKGENGYMVKLKLVDLGDGTFGLKAVADAKLTGSRVEEVLTQDNASDNVLTFEEPIQSIEIWHDEATPQDFIVNGITISVGPGGWRSPIGGTPDAEVTIPAGVTCIVKRLV